MKPDTETQVALSQIAAGAGVALMVCAALLVFIHTVLA
jgi:hypothetical protein